LRRAGALALVAVALAGCGGDDDEASSPPPAADSRCEAATSAIMTPLGNGLQNDQDELVNGQVVKSRDHEDIYFVSAELDGPGFTEPGDIGTWATTSPGGAEAIYSVDDLAKGESTWRDGTAIAGLSLEDDGAMESRECVKSASEESS
jgi:hypothetical protein